MPIIASAGPGTYEPSEKLTKQKMVNINMGSSQARPIKVDDTDVAPGQYNDGIRFDTGVKGF